MRTPLTALNAIALLLAGSLAGEGAAVARRSPRAQDGEARPHRRGKGGPRDAKAAAEAERLLAEGQAALGAKDLGGARRALEQSLRVAAGPEALFLLGQLAVAEGRLGFAHDLMRRFLHEQSGEPEGPQQKEAQKILQQPAGPLGEVAVLGARNAVVAVDDRLVGVLPLALPLLLPVGTHRVTVELSGQRVEEQVRVLPGQLAEMRFNPASRQASRRCSGQRAAAVQHLGNSRRPRHGACREPAVELAAQP
ncbi:MAG: hypothetical protein U1A78_03860 [Polyangia bacterium]